MVATDGTLTSIPIIQPVKLCDVSVKLCEALGPVKLSDIYISVTLCIASVKLSYVSETLSDK